MQMELVSFLSHSGVLIWVVSYRPSELWFEALEILLEVDYSSRETQEGDDDYDRLGFATGSGMVD